MTTTMLDRHIEERAKVWQRMLDIRAAAETDKRDMTAEERTNWDEAESRLTVLSGDIERLERAQRLEKIDRSQHFDTDGDEPEDRGGEAGDKAYRDAFGSFLRHGMNGLEAEERQLIRSHQAPIEGRAGATSPGSAGGFFIPTDTLRRITETMKAFGGILGVANVLNTGTGNPVNWPSNDDTGNTGAILAENSQVTEQDFTLGQKTLGSYTYTSKLVRISLQLLQDNVFNLENWLGGKLGERIGRAVAAHLATGTGTGQPEGLFTNATNGKVGATGQTTSVIYDDLVDVIHAVDPAYRNAGTVRWVMSDSALKVVRKLKDTQGRPLWEPSLQTGVPSNLMGYPITVDNGVPVPAANAKSIGFGDINAAMVVRQVAGGQLMRLEERYADFLQVGFLGFIRLDAKPDDGAAFRTYAHSAT